MMSHYYNYDLMKHINGDTDDRRMASASYCHLGKELLKASDTEAIRVVVSYHIGVNQAGCLDS